MRFPEKYQIRKTYFKSPWKKIDVKLLSNTKLIPRQDGIVMWIRIRFMAGQTSWIRICMGDADPYSSKTFKTVAKMKIYNNKRCPAIGYGKNLTSYIDFRVAGAANF